jgi:hypothetical protein
MQWKQARLEHSGKSPEPKTPPGNGGAVGLRRPGKSNIGTTWGVAKVSGEKNSEMYTERAT